MSNRMRKLNSQSGQALIMAVLVMLVVAVLAALFIAVIAAQLRQAQRQSLTIALQGIAEAGLRYADYNLVHGPDGADWRPDPNPGTFDYGENGEFQLTVSYRPEAGDPYSNFIKLESLATLKDNPFLRRRMVAYKPILVTDYIRFVANGEKSPLPASLGANTRMQLYEDPALGWPDRTYPWRLYKTVLDGPIRVNTDLHWHGDVQVNLESARGDNVAVAGDISHDPGGHWNASTGGWYAPDDPDPSHVSQVQVSVDAGAPQAVLPSGRAGFTTLGGSYGGVYRTFYRDGRQQSDVNGDPRWVRYIDPPTLDPARYLALTRDSGTWIAGEGDYAGRQVNTGWFGYGKGLYINNPEHIKYEHDYEQMRSEWIAASGTYAPDAVVIELMPGPPIQPGVENGRPFLRLTWAGGGFRSRLGALVGTTVNLPYPQNGVIYAAGDVSVKGTLQRRVGSPKKYYDQQPYVFPNDPIGQTWSAGTEANDTNRNYHLTIVSGGNIFIVGNILGPVSAGLPGANADTDTKLALLARDSVVLNTLGFQQVLQYAYDVVIEGRRYYEVRPGGPLDVLCPSSASARPIGMYFTHTGQPNILLPLGHAGSAIMQVLINGVPYDWGNIEGVPFPVYDGSTNYFLFAPPPVVPPPPPSTPNNNETNAIYPIEESIPNVLYGAVKRVTFPPTAVGSQVIRFQVTSGSPRFYWVAVDSIRFRIDVEIDAAVYAEHGSWYVIPGPFVTAPEPTNGDPAYDPAAPPEPLPGEPIDTQITIFGAVSENRTAPLADVNDWVAKWRGSNAAWLSGSSYGISYVYDMALRAPLVADEPGSRPRLPKLPVSPAMIAWGERI